MNLLISCRGMPGPIFVKLSRDIIPQLFSCGLLFVDHKITAKVYSALLALRVHFSKLVKWSLLSIPTRQ
jgi:hypothetical protein